MFNQFEDPFQAVVKDLIREKPLREVNTSPQTSTAPTSGNSLWDGSYPDIETPIARFQWAKENSTVNRLLLGRVRTFFHPDQIPGTIEAANRFGRALGVHATWLQGCDVNQARKATAGVRTESSIRRCLVELASGGYQFDAIFSADHSQSRIGSRLQFSILRYELEKGQRLTIDGLAQKAVVNIGFVNRAIETGVVSVRIVVRLARVLNVSAMWLHTGHGGIPANKNDWAKYLKYLEKTSCQGDRLDLAKLCIDYETDDGDGWSAVGAEMGCNKAILSLYRNCKRRLSAPHAERIGKYLNVDPAWLSDSALGDCGHQGCSDHNSPAESAAPSQGLTTISSRIAHAKSLIDQKYNRSVSWKEIADRAGVSQGWFSLYAKNRRPITWNACLTLGLGLDVSALWLWTGTGQLLRNQADLGEAMLLQETR